MSVIHGIVSDISDCVPLQCRAGSGVTTSPQGKVNRTYDSQQRESVYHVYANADDTKHLRSVAIGTVVAITAVSVGIKYSKAKTKKDTKTRINSPIGRRNNYNSRKKQRKQLKKQVEERNL